MEASPAFSPSYQKRLLRAVRAQDRVAGEAVVQEIKAEVRTHRQQKNWHARQARNRLNDLNEFRAALEQLGVNVVIEDTNTNPLGGTGDSSEDKAGT